MIMKEGLVLNKVRMKKREKGKGVKVKFLTQRLI